MIPFLTWRASSLKKTVFHLSRTHFLRERRRARRLSIARWSAAFQGSFLHANDAPFQSGFEAHHCYYAEGPPFVSIPTTGFGQRRAQIDAEPSW